MCKVRTGEYLNAIQDNLEYQNVVITSIKTETSWGGVYYCWHIYILNFLLRKLSFKELESYNKDGISAVLGNTEALEESHAHNENFDLAVEELFYKLYEKGCINE